MASALQLRGFDELMAELDQLAPGLADEATTTQQQLTAETADQLRAALPRGATGALAESVEVRPLPARVAFRVVSEVAVTASYAPYVEFGTRYTPPRPRFVPITRRGREAFQRAVIALVRAVGLEVRGGADV